MSHARLVVNLREENPLVKSIYWAEQFLNKLGGDFSITVLNHDCAVITNTRSCAGLCDGGSDRMCSDIERAINNAIRVFDNDLLASFVNCGNDEGDLCKLEINIK